MEGIQSRRVWLGFDGKQHGVLSSFSVQQAHCSTQAWWDPSELKFFTGSITHLQPFHSWITTSGCSHQDTTLSSLVVQTLQRWRISNSAKSQSGEMLRPWHETQPVSLEMAFALIPLSPVINLAKVFSTLIFLSCWCVAVEPQRSIVWQWQRRNPHPLWVAVVFYFLWLSTLYFISWILGSRLSLCFHSCGWELHECALHSFVSPC